MHTDALDIILGFFEGFALIISPCILPILPIVLAGSLAGSKKRPMGIITGFVTIFVLVAFFSRRLVQSLGFDLSILRTVSYTLLLALGAIMLSSYLTALLSQRLQQLLGHLNLSQKYKTSDGFSDGFISGLLFGGLIALIWTPCAGPILAAVIVQTVLQQSTLISFLTLVTFTVGAALPMLLIALYGKHIMRQTAFFKTKSSLFRKLLGLMIISSVIYMIAQEHITQTSPPIKTAIKTATRLENGLWLPYQAPALDPAMTWINSKPLSLAALKGQVVLVDFWTYSCINCIRTLPYLNSFYKQYHNKGLTLIGVHSPEFDFEKNRDHVEQAVIRDSIKYPVALDNQFITWENFNNHYWPAHYLIDKKGRVVYTHFGEGDDDILENNIRFLLHIDGLAAPPLISLDAFQIKHQTPETYLGYARADETHAPYLIHNKAAAYTLKKPLAMDAWGLQGLWQVLSDKIISTQANTVLQLHFQAKFVYIVMGTQTNLPIKISLRLEDNQGHLLQNNLENHRIISQQTIYTLVALPKTTEGTLTLTSDAPGLEIYTFTFGN